MAKDNKVDVSKQPIDINSQNQSSSSSEEQPIVRQTKSDAEIRAEALGRYRNENEGAWGSYSGRYTRMAKENKKTKSRTYPYENEENDFFKGGFYYDSQLENPYLSISLHANTKINSEGKWEAWPGDHLEAVYKGNEWSKCYGADPIARCIMPEDFSYSISNNFSDYNGGNPIESAFESIKPYAPILEAFSKGAGEAVKSVEDSNYFGSSAAQGLTNLLKKSGDLFGAASGYLNRGLLVQGTRFTYYNGTEFNFNNLEMKFLVFSDYVKQNGVWKFQSVEDYIKTLQPYVMGIYSKYSAELIEKLGLNEGEEPSEFRTNVRNFISEYVGFQDPPGGFSMDTKNLDNTLKGTLRLNIGGTWAIENLVIKNMNVNMSRVQAKDPTVPGGTVPLYAEVILQLTPVCKLVDTGYRNILDHNGMSEIRNSVTKGYRTKLTKLKETTIPSNRNKK